MCNYASYSDLHSINATMRAYGVVPTASKCSCHLWTWIPITWHKQDPWFISVPETFVEVVCLLWRLKMICVGVIQSALTFRSSMAFEVCARQTKWTRGGLPVKETEGGACLGEMVCDTVAGHGQFTTIFYPIFTIGIFLPVQRDFLTQNKLILILIDPLVFQFWISGVIKWAIYAFISLSHQFSSIQY